MAYKAKNQVNIQNALCQLQLDTYVPCNKLGWLSHTQNILQYKEKEVLNKLAKKGTQMFHKRWAFNPSNMDFDTMQSSSYLIPQLVVNQFYDIKNCEVELFWDGKLVDEDSGENWSL